ncbi:MAG TPA: hypothetical protein PL000_07285 [Anaerolineales bacterium]|nr:hypothetical protein [Anaerolineales bacterium]
MTKVLNESMSNEALNALPIVPIDGRQPANEKEEKYLREIGVYEFQNLEDPGLQITFPYGGTKKSQKFILMHGGRYKLPRHVANWIESRGEPIYKWKPNGEGRMESTYSGRKPRFSLRPVFGS